MDEKFCDKTNFIADEDDFLLLSCFNRLSNRTFSPRNCCAERMSQGGWDSEIMLMESNQLFRPETFPNIIFHEVISGLRKLILMVTRVPSQSTHDAYQ